jgi:glutamate-1-semialdehyde 2,1-aminomutase
MKAKALKLDISEQNWARTLAAVPAGCQTFSKAPNQHVTGVSPKYLAKGKGSHVWDLDGNEYIDYMLGLGPVILGHADQEVNDAVIKAMNDGISMSLPHLLETKLSEMLIERIPCAEMVRLGKNGSDVTSAAIRVARAYTGREQVAACGYHGWQDWYIGTTARNLGVPEDVQRLTTVFHYNQIESLEKIFQEYPGKIAAVILEPVNFFEPKDDFLQKVKDLAHSEGALLIFDEIITGFRFDLGGAQKIYGVTPDLATFGKAMGNGFPISAVLGKKDVMDWFEKVFFSFTFGGETASIAAAIATIQAMENRDSINVIRRTGEKLMDGYQALIGKLDISALTKMIGFPFWPEYLFFDKEGKVSREIQSLFQQEIVRRGVLTRAGMMISSAHTNEDINRTLEVFEQALTVIKEAVKSDNVLNWLNGEVIMPVIRKVD